MILDLSLYIFAFIFPQRTCFGSNNRRWKGFFCRLSVLLVLSACSQFGPRLLVSFSRSIWHVRVPGARKTKVATAPDHFFFFFLTDHKKKEHVLESFILGTLHC